MAFTVYYKGSYQWTRSGVCSGRGVNVYDAGYFYSNKASTTYRRKPLDLFLNGTFRTSSRVISGTVTPGLYLTSPYANCYLHSEGPETIGISSAMYQYGVEGPVITSAQNALIRTALLSKIKAQRANLALSLAEVRKTADTIRGTAEDLWRFFQALRRGRTVKALARELSRPSGLPGRRLSREWLRFTYGILPTLQDVYGSIDELSGSIIAGKYLKVQVKRSFNDRGEVPYYGGSTKYTVEKTIRGKARYMIENAGLKQLSQVGITNPAELAWQLLPWTFILDWVIDIGGYLGTIDSLVGVKPGSAIYIQSLRFSQDLYRSGGSSSSNCVRMPVSRSKYEAYYRSIPMALTASYPVYSPHISVRRMLSALSLLRGISP